MPRFQSDADNLVPFREAFNALQGDPPFSWQERLFGELCAGRLPAALDLPTGLGKTSVMSIWLIARALADDEARKQLPRRLVYVVDRRAVVDQASAEAVKLRCALEDAANEKAAWLNAKLGLGKKQLPISTLRGRHADNRDWLADPVAAAIIVGTVDMIGSRLLFSGYGVSRKMRPFHAGFLGADALVVLDEAHLVPAFETLLESIERDVDVLGARDANDRKAIPPFRLLSLSATGRSRAGRIFQLCETDLEHEIVKCRMNARKAVRIHEAGGQKLETVLAGQAWTLADEGASNISCLVYCDSRGTAEKTKREIERLAGADKRKNGGAAIETELLVGARRVKEREDAARRLEALGFMAGRSSPRDRPAFLIATSAGEVGIDLDADHMVCDLVPWERMVQRLGRVNRRGHGDARIVVVDAGAPKPTKPAEPTPREMRAIIAHRALSIIDELSRDERGINASPGELRRLSLRAARDVDLKARIGSASTPEPLRPALSRALVDAWSMTSLDAHAGRPDIQWWLRGWGEDDEPQTVIVWRRHLPVRLQDGRPVRVSKSEIDDFFEAAPPHLSEMLETQSWRAAEWLLERAKAKAAEIEKRKKAGGPDQSSVVAFVLDAKGEVDRDDKRRGQWTLGALAELDKKEREAFSESLKNRMLVVATTLGGLHEGMLDDKGGEPPAMDADESWELRPFRVHETDSPMPILKPGWKPSHRFATEMGEDGTETRWIVVDERRGQAETEDSRAVSSREQVLGDHRQATKRIVLRFAMELGLRDFTDMLALAALLHDEGKSFWRWQRAFNAPRDAVYAKTKGPTNLKLLDGYRHEFESLLRIESDPDFGRLPPDLKDLALHLVAAHHGGARPLISTQSCERAPADLEAGARNVALRFAELQKRWGPWGLAWWEALLRAADQQASRENDAPEDGNDGAGGKV